MQEHKLEFAVFLIHYKSKDLEANVLILFFLGFVDTVPVQVPKSRLALVILTHVITKEAYLCILFINFNRKGIPDVLN